MPFLLPPRRSSAAVLVVLGLVTAGRAGDAKPAKPLIADGERMLFIGNSYTANEGGVQTYLQRAVAKADEWRIAVDKRIYYGKPLRDMLTDDVRRAIASDRYDTVVFTSGRFETMQQFHGLVREAGKNPVVFMTWEGSHPGNRATVERYTAATKRAVESMRRMERETSATIVPVAVVYHDLTLRPPREGLRVDYLWRPGNIHQNELGTLVNAWTMYAVLTGRSPVGVDFDVAPWVVGEKLKANPDIPLDTELRRALQRRVETVVRDWRRGKCHLEE